VLVSRSHPGLLRRLFDLEVPELQEGVVEIKAQAREAGARSKIAVCSRQENVDPVGACVGHRGSRVQAVVDELRGEKVDIVRWSEEPEKYVASALSPAKVSHVTIDEGTRSAMVVAPDNQLSLAIGREGQNVRLAARLTGWRIDIRSEAQVAQMEAEAQARALAAAAEAAAPAEESEAVAPEVEELISAEEGAPVEPEQAEAVEVEMVCAEDEETATEPALLEVPELEAPETETVSAEDEEIAPEPVEAEPQEA
jgi:N utilization substance protein A